MRSIKCNLFPLLISVLLVAFGSIVVAAEELADEQVLDVGFLASEMGTFDPHGVDTSQDALVKDSIFNYLVRYPYGKAAGELQPSLATSWEVSDDGKTWTFYLREGVKWHRDYGQFTAEDVKYSFDRVRTADISIYRTHPTVDIIDEVEIVDDFTVKFHLNSTDFDFAFDLPVTGAAQIVCKEAVEELGEDYGTNPIGTGAFMFEEHVPGERVVMVRNEDYFEGAPILEKVVGHYIPETSSRNMALITGRIDATKGPTTQTWIDEMEGEGMITNTLGPGFTGILAFNLTVEPLNNEKVRKAIAYAIDREEIAAYFGKDIAPIQISPVPPTWRYYTECEACIPKYEQDLEKAKQLLEEAGYEDGFTLENYTSESDYYRDHYEILQAQLSRIGINVDITVVDHSTFHANQREDLNTLPIVGYGPDNDGGKVLNLFFHSDSIVGKEGAFYNFSHYGDEVGSVDHYLEAAKGQLPEVKQALFEVAQRRILEDLAAYPTVNLGQPVARQPYLELGYELEATLTTHYVITPETRILAR